MKIVHVAQFFQPKVGYQEAFLARRQMELGHEVVVLTSDRYIYYPNYESIYKPILGDRIVGPVRRLEEGIDTWRLPTFEFQNHPWCPGLGKALDALSPDAVHLHNVAHFMALSVLWHKRKGVPYRLIIDEHDTAQVMNPSAAHRAYRTFFRKVMAGAVNKYAHGVLGVTSDSCVVAENQFGVDPKIIGMIPLGSDHQKYIFSEQGRNLIRAELGIPKHASVIMFTGKIQPLKRPDALIEALPEIQRSLPETHVVLVGHPVADYLEHIQERIAALNLERYVHLCEAVPAVELPAWFSAADLCCWPTEVTISMIDAASCSRPILVPRADGVEYQVSGDNGEFIQDMTLKPETLGPQISALLGDEEKLARLGNNGRALVEGQLSWHAVTDRYQQLYEGAPVVPYNRQGSTYARGKVDPYGSHIKAHDLSLTGTR